MTNSGQNLIAAPQDDTRRGTIFPLDAGSDIDNLERG